MLEFQFLALNAVKALVKALEFLDMHEVRGLHPSMEVSFCKNAGYAVKMKISPLNTANLTKLYRIHC